MYASTMSSTMLHAGCPALSHCRGMPGLPWASTCRKQSYIQCPVTLCTYYPCWVQTFWHSSAHVLGEALESCFGAKLTIGPALEEGFYYDCYLGNRTLTEADRPVLEARFNEAS